MNRGEPAPPSLAEAIVGRGTELRLIRSFLDEALTRGGALVLSGEPGMGKSVLLDAAVETACERGTRVLRASGIEFETDVGLAGLNQVIAPVHEELDHLTKAHRDALLVVSGAADDPPSDPLVVSAAVLALLHQVSEEGPLLVVVDDLHWIDRASTALLGFVARRLTGAPIGFLAASRSATDGSLELMRLPELELRPLDDDSALDLVLARFPALAAPVRRRVLTEAQGNPLALLELPAGLSGPQRAAAETLPPVLPLGRRLQLLFESRIRELAEPTRQLLLVAALDGSGGLHVLGAAEQGHPGLDDLAAAEDAGLVQVGDTTGRVAFRHPLIRSTVVGLAGDDDRRRAHGLLAEVFEDQPERHAWHLAEATARPDEHTAGLLEQAGYLSLRRGDAAPAVATMLRAAELSPDSAARSRRLAVAAYLAAAVTGDLVSGARLLVDARVEDTAAHGSLRTAVAAAFLLLNGDGDVETAHRLLVESIETYADDPEDDDHGVAEALSTLLQVCCFGGRAQLWEPFHAAVARFGERVPAVLDLCSKTVPDPVRTAAPALDHLTTAIEGLREEEDPTRIVQTGMAALSVDRLSGCREALWRVVRDGRAGGAVASAINALMLLCFADLLAGQWTEAQRWAEESLELCRQHGYRLLALPGQLAQAWLAAVRGEEESVRALTDQMLGWATSRRVGIVEVYACHATALAALGCQDYEKAYRQVVLVSPPGSLPSHRAHALWVTMDLVEAAVHTDRRAEADAHVSAMRAADLAALSPRLALLVAGSEAMTATGPDAAKLYERAIAVPGAGRWPFELARIQLAYGRHLRTEGAATESRVQLSAALDTFGRLGAVPWIAQARQALRAAGHTTPMLNGFSSAATLTPKEHEVAVLAAAGLSNKQIGARLFVSHRTVGDHLHKVFPKLGVTSRAALGDALAAIEPPD